MMTILPVPSPMEEADIFAERERIRAMFDATIEDAEGAIEFVVNAFLALDSDTRALVIGSKCLLDHADLAPKTRKRAELRIDRQAREIRQRIAGIVTVIQFHDLLRQRLESISRQVDLALQGDLSSRLATAASHAHIHSPAELTSEIPHCDFDNTTLF